MYKDIKKQISNQTREPLDHVRVPQQPGILFKDSGNRSIYNTGVLRFNRKLFNLQRSDNFTLTRQVFDLYGGSNIFSTINSTTDGALIDTYIPVYSNVEYSTSFVPNKDIVISLPYELSQNSIATVYIGSSDNDLLIPKYTLSNQTGKITLNLVAGEQIKIFIYYYNFNNITNVYGSISILEGLAEHISSWSYIDVTPPSVPEWYSTPLVTFAADPGAATTKVVLQFKAPVTWPSNWDQLDETSRFGILNDPDLAGHNFYRVASNTITTGTVEIGDPDESPQTVIYSGNLMDKLIHGQDTYSNNSVLAAAKLSETTDLDVGTATITESGNVRFKMWSNFPRGIDEEKIYNSDFEISTHGYTPSGWSVSGSGVAIAKYKDSKIGYYCYLNNNISGNTSIYQYINTKKSHNFKLSYNIDVSTGICNIYVKKGTDIIASSILSGNGYYADSVYFNSPMNTGVNVYVTASSYSVLNIYNVSLKDITPSFATEYNSSTRNYIVNGGFENSLTGWNSLSISDLSWDNPLFGYKTPTITANSGAGIYQVTTISNNQGGMLSAYLNVYTGSVNIYRLGGTATVVSSTNGWIRRAQYTSTGYNTVLIIANENNTIFSVDGVQLEAGRKLTSFDDINSDGTTTRPATFIKYSGINLSGSQGTVRVWFTPSWKSSDYVSPGDLKYVWARGSGTQLWTFEYNGYYGTYELTTISGATFGQIGVPHTSLNRHETVHLVCTWSGTNTEIWVNGVKGTVNEAIYTNRIRRDISSDIFFVGGLDGAGSNCADGAVEGLIVDSKLWTPTMILMDYRASSAEIGSGLTISNTRTRSGNLVYNSNFALRNSLTDIHGWYINTSGSTSIIADYSKPKFGDVSLKITT